MTIHELQQSTLVSFYFVRYGPSTEEIEWVDEAKLRSRLVAGVPGMSATPYRRWGPVVDDGRGLHPSIIEFNLHTYYPEWWRHTRKAKAVQDQLLATNPDGWVSNFVLDMRYGKVQTCVWCVSAKNQLTTTVNPDGLLYFLRKLLTECDGAPQIDLRIELTGVGNEGDCTSMQVAVDKSGVRCRLADI